MKLRNLNYLIGFGLLIALVCFFFYKSIFSDKPLTETLASINEIQDLQVELHRDLLRYRNNQILQYDTLNQTLFALDSNMVNLWQNEIARTNIGSDTLNNLDQLITEQALLIEDFKTHHSILQNSLYYIFNVSSDLYSGRPKTQSKEQLRITAELLALLLEYKEQPSHRIANRIYPLIDTLNLNPDSDTKSLINHSLMIIERLPEIDDIMSRFNSLKLEKQITLLKQKVNELRKKENKNAQIFNALLFLSTLYLIIYMLYIFIKQRNNEEALSKTNERLNDEIELRTRTERALYQLVNIDKNSHGNSEDRILFLLNALCTALDVEYAYISKLRSSGTSAELIGMLDHGMFSSNKTYQLKDTPCEEVFENGRLVFNRDFSDYFTNHMLGTASSYIGISLTDQNDDVIGMIAVASESPVADTNLSENILTIASSRAIIELERQVEINYNQRYQNGLEVIDGWIARLITEGYDREAFFKNICRAAQEITNAQLAAFPVLNNDNESYYFLSASGLQAEQLENLTLDVDDGGICAWTILNNDSLMINDVATDPRAQVQLSEQFNIKSALLTPVTLKEQPYGALSVFRSFDEFDRVDEQLLTQFAQSVQMAIINMQLVSDMKSERERAEVTLHSIGDAVITTNVHGEIEYMNHVAEALTGWSLSDARNLSVQTVFRIEDMDTGEPVHDLVMACIDDSITINKSILSLVNRKGKKKDIESSISPILNTSGNTEGVVIVFHDETQRRQLENTIKHQAAHDTLTDLLNRDAFDIELSDRVYDARNNERYHVLCYLDLDRFKLVNDTAGHIAGDQCLIQATSIIQSCIRSDDVFGRLGGDEFGLILQNCDVNSAVRIAENISRAISEMSFRWDGCDYKLGISIGINPLDKNTQDTADAIRRADLACYAAKDQANNHIYVYEEQDSELIRRQEETYWATRISDAIENDRLQLFAQPIVSLKNKNIRPNETQFDHVEILVRLLDDDGQLIPPNAFVPAAERYNLMNLVDRKIILETFSFIYDNDEFDNSHTHYSINLSGNSLSDKDFAGHVLEQAERFDISSRRICFEITETAAIKNLHQAKLLIKELKAAGFQFALDDFGSGLSSFHYLKNLHVDYLKIDGSFVADMVNNNIDRAMVAAISEVGHVMGIKTIAEYVENEQIIKKLQDIDVDFGQGYGIEQPKPLQDLFAQGKKKDSPTLKVIHNKS